MSHQSRICQKCGHENHHHGVDCVKCHGELVPVLGSALFFAEMLKLATMTEAQEQHIRITERCPTCVPHEGEAQPMRLLGDFGPVRGYQCNHCNNVWCIRAPNSDYQTPGSHNAKRD